ncbi:predicted protein [Postia placenta Mad-698-R]|nr:predicted protein [Postia placenta Mad-698-R]
MWWSPEDDAQRVALRARSTGTDRCHFGHRTHQLDVRNGYARGWFGGFLDLFRGHEQASNRQTHPAIYKQERAVNEAPFGAHYQPVSHARPWAQRCPGGISGRPRIEASGKLDNDGMTPRERTIIQSKSPMTTSAKRDKYTRGIFTKFDAANTPSPQSAKGGKHRETANYNTLTLVYFGLRHLCLLVYCNMKKEYSPLPGWDTEIAADTDAVTDGIERCNNALVDQCWETQGEGVAVSTAYQEVPTGTVLVLDMETSTSSQAALTSAAACPSDTSEDSYNASDAHSRGYGSSISCAYAPGLRDTEQGANTQKYENHQIGNTSGHTNGANSGSKVVDDANVTDSEPGCADNASRSDSRENSPPTAPPMVDEAIFSRRIDRSEWATLPRRVTRSITNAAASTSTQASASTAGPSTVRRGQKRKSPDEDEKDDDDSAIEEHGADEDQELEDDGDENTRPVARGPDGRWPCKEWQCSNTYTREHDMLRHWRSCKMRPAHLRASWTCPDCGKSYSRRDAKGRHKQTACKGKDLGQGTGDGNSGGRGSKGGKKRGGGSGGRKRARSG